MPFVDPFAIDLVLEELPLNVCNAFWHPKGGRITAYEKCKLLSVTGGVPLYLERIKPDLSAEQNIRDLCFTKGGLLVREFDEIFSSGNKQALTLHSQIFEHFFVCFAIYKGSCA